MEILSYESFKSKVFDYDKNKIWNFTGEKPVIVDFYADWCAPCRALSPILEEISIEYAGKIDVYKVNTESTPELAALFGVRGIPALLFIPKIGQPAMNAGFLPKEQLQHAISEILGVK